jgi:hypothetical protein
MQWVTDFYATQRLWSTSRVIFAGNSLDPLNSLGVPSPARGDDVVFQARLSFTVPRLTVLTRLSL